MKTLSPDHIEAMKILHPDTVCTDIQCDRAAFNPITSATIVPVCYREEVTREVKTWYGRTKTVTDVVHKHYSATFMPNRPWEYIGTDELPPFAVAMALTEGYAKSEGYRKQMASPEIITACVLHVLNQWDAIARETFFELLSDAPVVGPELRAYVRPANKVDAALKPDARRN